MTGTDFVVELLTRGVVVTGVALILTRAAIGRAPRASAAVLTLALLAMAGLPALVAGGPRFAIAVLPQSEAAVGGLAYAPDVSPQRREWPAAPRPAERAATRYADVPPTPPPVSPWLVTYLSMAVLLLCVRGSAICRASGIVRRARQPVPAALHGAALEAARALGRAGPVRVRVSSETEWPFVSGFVRPTVVVPRASASWSEARLRCVLLHELGHIVRRDVMAHAIAEAACALNWFNPLVWIAARRLRVHAEIACDDHVLSAGVAADAYASELVLLARHLNGRSSMTRSVGIGAASELKERIRWIVGERRPGIGRARLAAALVAACAASITAVLCEPVAADGQTSVTSVNVSTSGPEVSSNGSGLQARWSENGLHRALFLTGQVDLTDAGAGLVSGDGAIVLIDETANGVSIFEWRPQAGVVLSERVRRTLSVGARQLARLTDGHSKGLPGSTLSGLPAVSEDPSARVVQAGWRSGDRRYGLAMRGNWGLTGDEPTSGDSRAWFLVFDVDPRTGATRRGQIVGDGGTRTLAIFSNGSPATPTDEARAWVAAALRSFQKLAPGLGGF